MGTIRKHHEAGAAPAAEAPGHDAPSMKLVCRRIADANAAYVQAHAPADLPPTPRLALAVVACMDCRLTNRLDEALGLHPGDAIVLRVAGNTAAGSDDVTRSLAVAILEMGVHNVLVVGHTHCGMTRIDPLAFSERLSERGVSRFALGFSPLREWLGLFSNEAKNVRETVERIRRSPALPRDVAVAGALFNTETGELAWLETA